MYANTFNNLQAAIDATPDGGLLYLPAGDYPVSGSGDQLLLISKAITIQGEGRGSRIVVASSVPSTTDVMRVHGAGTQIEGLRLSDFAIVPQSGQPARYGLNLDSKSGQHVIANATICRLSIGSFGSEAIALFGPTPPAFDGVFTSSITECSLSNGMLLDQAGDSLTITQNTFSGNGRITINLIGRGSNTAHGFVFMFNNVTCTGGIQVINAWQGSISYNNIELYEGATGSNGAVLDLDGNTTIPPESFEVRSNYIGPGSAGITSIRVNNTKSTRIEGNTLPRSIGGKTIVITANGDRTQIFANRNQPYGELIGAWLQDNGTNTQIVYIDPNTGKLTIPQQVNVGAIQIGNGSPIVNSSRITQYAGEIITTNTDSDVLIDPRIKAGAVCSAVPYNSIAAQMTGVYAAAGDGLVRLFHPQVAGGGFSILYTGP
jgi:hypothetical protein